MHRNICLSYYYPNEKNSLKPRRIELVNKRKVQMDENLYSAYIAPGIVVSA